MTQQSIRVLLPSQLRDMIGAQGEISLLVQGEISQRAVINALEAKHPMLRGTVRDPVTQRRRSLVRLYACERDLSNAEPDELLPEAVRTGDEPYLIVGAIAGG